MRFPGQLQDVKILVVGKGFIGEAVGERLEEEHQVKYLDRSSGDVQQDITRAFKIEQHFDVVIHTVGLAPGFSTATEYQRVHEAGTRHVVNGIDADKIIYISALRAGEVDHSFFQTKREAEKIVEESEMEHTIIRPSTVTGEGNKLLDMIRDLAFTRVFPNITTRAQPIRLENLVEMVEQVLDSRDGETLNAAGPVSMTMGEMGRRIYNQERYMCLLLPAPRVFLEWSMVDIFPAPFHAENRELLRHDNTAEKNHALDMVELDAPF
jgi:uncharacterized protein YbjT (DUF2867 family)